MIEEVEKKNRFVLLNFQFSSPSTSSGLFVVVLFSAVSTYAKELRI